MGAEQGKILSRGHDGRPVQNGLDREVPRPDAEVADISSSMVTVRAVPRSAEMRISRDDVPVRVIMRWVPGGCYLPTFRNRNLLGI